MKDSTAGYADWLVTTTCDSFARGCARLVDPPLVPPFGDVDRALRLLAPLVEALEGFAIGSILGHVSFAVRRWFGDDAGRALLGKLRRHVRVRATAETELAETLAGELAARLHPRLARIPTAAIVEDAAAHVASPAMVGAAFELACKDELLAERLVTELQIGWEHYRAALKGVRLPTVSPLWSRWTQKIAGDRPSATCERDHILQIG